MVMPAGIYALRSSSVIVVRQPFQPLMIAAVFAFSASADNILPRPNKAGRVAIYSGRAVRRRNADQRYAIFQT